MSAHNPSAASTEGPATGERLPLSSVRDLVLVGEPLPFRVLDAQGRLLLAFGQKVSSDGQLAALLERGATVETEAVRQVRETRAAAAQGIARLMSTRKLSLFDRWEQSLWALDTLLRKFTRLPGAGDDLRAFTDAHITLIDRDPDVALFLAIRRDDRRFALYGLAHALHTATLVVLAARGLGFDAAKVHSLAGAALTMNASMMELQAQMAEQKEPPSQKQLEHIRGHPMRSVKLLQDAGITDTAWIAAVTQHHEQPGGGGYPQGLAQPHPAARLLRAADVFMAKITPRAFRPPLRPPLAARQLYQEEEGGPIANGIIKAVGVYPPGEVVVLKTGEHAIVIRRNAGGSPAPLVAAYTDRHGLPITSTTRRDTAQAEFAIAQPLPDLSRMPRLLPERVYGWIDG